MTEPTPETAVQRVLQRFYHIDRCMRQQAQVVSGVRDLTLLQVQALFHIKTQGSVMLRELAEELHISPASCSLLVDRLVDIEWVERTRDEGDRRVTHLKLSEEAKNELAEIMRSKTEKISAALGNLLSDDLASLDRILAIIESNLSPNQPA